MAANNPTSLADKVVPFFKRISPTEKSNPDSRINFSYKTFFFIKI